MPNISHLRTTYIEQRTSPRRQLIHHLPIQSSIKIQLVVRKRHPPQEISVKRRDVVPPEMQYMSARSLASAMSKLCLQAGRTVPSLA